MAAIAQRGLGGVRMSHIGELAGMSPGHVLYYFGSKERILVETLRWSEEQLAGRRARELMAIGRQADRLVRFVELYAPEGKGDPRWTLWLEVWARAHMHASVLQVQSELERAWADDLGAIVDLGVRTGEFDPVDQPAFVERFLALLDGLAVQVLIGSLNMPRSRSVRIGVAAAARELGFADPHAAEDRPRR